MRGSARYRRSEIGRVIRGAEAVGKVVVGVEVDGDSGTWRVLFGGPDKPSDPNVEQWMSKQNAHKR
jgi:hypothetical protein